MKIEFIVCGEAKGKARPRFARGHVYTPESTRQYERSIRTAYLKAADGFSFGNAPVKVCIAVYVCRPKSVKRVKPTVKPDLDNIIKVVLDGLNGVAFDDDKQVCAVEAEKLYTDKASYIKGSVYAD